MTTSADGTGGVRMPEEGHPARVEKAYQPSAEPLWTRVEPVSSGVHKATLTNIRLTLGATSGKPVFLWTFKLDSGQEVSYYTSKRGEGARKGYECAKALGLSRKFSPDEAVGRRCRIELDSSGQWIDIERVLPE